MQNRFALGSGLIALAMAMPAAAQETFQVELAGDLGLNLTIAQDLGELTTTITLAQGSLILRELTIGNAAVDKEAIETVRLCAGCSPVVCSSPPMIVPLPMALCLRC